ncbi:PREDICTED: single-stranded DNA-binding protein, mitochondrial [Fragaria vesca subsp. vesca]|uniref:single-stranded DNA-binding protein, mitochondrial n=1 Tax=Fragaria vesca subsp. vesca TaxID=101020 RepID=UPI0002C2F15F|nr:PREDICTED: single-stranded DNA-binding protein, mitochondrial [Fragaria vesca subsp. vesca]
MASLSRRLLLFRSLYHSNPNSVLFTRFCTTASSSSDSSDSDKPVTPDLESESRPDPTRRVFRNQPLEKGVDVGIYKAILVGQVGQTPMQKILKSGAAVTMFSLGTGGIRNNRRPLQTESPTEYANRCEVQWHRVCVYPERLGKIAVQNAPPGSIIYVEGNLETKIFTDPVTGLVRRVREIAVRKNGRLVFLGNGNIAEPAVKGIRGVGYY